MSDMYIINAGDVVSGKMATAFLKYEGRNIPCSWFTSLEATMRKKKTEAPRLGATSLMSRTMGWTGGGKVKMYYATSLLRRLALEYAKTGKEVLVDLVVTNEDPAATLGAQAVLLKNVSFDAVPLAKFDAQSSDPLSEELSFTFDDFELLSEFTHPAIADVE